MRSETGAVSIAVLASCAGAASRRLNWLSLTLAGGPTIASHSALAFDSARGVSVHFGGLVDVAIPCRGHPVPHSSG